MYRTASKVSGRARNELIASIRKTLHEYDRGKPASDCMDDIQKSVKDYDKRLPQNQK